MLNDTDYENLIRKYIDPLRQAEGIDFIDRIGEKFFSDVELGLPLGLIEHLQIAPAPLDLDESDDPYGLHKTADVEPNAC
jgi:hypothetical protein